MLLNQVHKLRAWEESRMRQFVILSASVAFNQMSMSLPEVVKPGKSLFWIWPPEARGPLLSQDRVLT